MTIHVPDFEEATKLSDEIVEQICPLLFGQHPALQGIVVAELMAMWLAGHDPTLRDAMLQVQLQALPGLVEMWHDRLRGRRQ